MKALGVSVIAASCSSFASIVVVSDALLKSLCNQYSKQNCLDIFYLTQMIGAKSCLSKCLVFFWIGSQHKSECVPKCDFHLNTDLTN